MSNDENQKKKDIARKLDALDPSSAPQEKATGEDLGLLVAQLKQRAQGLDGQDLEDEIQRFLDKMIERHAKVVPAPLRAEHRKLLLGYLAEDPTLQSMIETLRKHAPKG